uniref:Uncharacterized protein n=1 Tax=Avena sativa TaxID=4498 RepID=A0ACD5VPL5_AVESA
MASPEGGALVPPHRRKGGAPDPNYELRPNKFTVAMHHGGFFYGIGTNRAYIDGKLDFFDECDNQTWSQDSIDNMLNQLGYPASWLEHKKSRRGAATGNEEIKEEFVPDEEVKKADSDINDSDYDFEDGEEESDAFEDDSDYKKNIDADVEDGQLGKKEANHVWPDDGVPEDDYLEPLPAEDDLLKSFKARIFNPVVDMENPIFKLAMAFSTMQEVRNAVAQYSVKNRVQVKKKRNNSVRLEAHCAEGCTCQLVISWDNRTEKFLVKEYVGEHSCESVWNVKEMTYLWLANRYVEFFRDNESVSIKAFGKHVQGELNILPTRFKLAKAKYAALEVIHGDEKMQYNNLWDYGEELRNRNPGTSFYLRTIGNPGIFSTCYFP